MFPVVRYLWQCMALKTLNSISLKTEAVVSPGGYDVYKWDGFQRTFKLSVEKWIFRIKLIFNLFIRHSSIEGSMKLLLTYLIFQIQPINPKFMHSRELHEKIKNFENEIIKN